MNGSAADIKVVPVDTIGVAYYVAATTDLSGVPVPAHYFLNIAISDKANVCQELTYRNTQPNESSLNLTLDRRDGEEIAVGTHPISAWSEPVAEKGLRATANFNRTDAQCKGSTDFEATFARSGTITLTEVSKTQAIGSFDLTFASGAVKGTFVAPICRSFIVTELRASFTCEP